MTLSNLKRPPTGDTKVTLNHLASDSVIVHCPFGLIFTSSIFSATWIMSPGSVDLLSHTSCAIRVNNIKKLPANMNPPKMEVWKMSFSFSNAVIFSFHADLLGGDVFVQVIFLVVKTWQVQRSFIYLTFKRHFFWQPLGKILLSLLNF